MSSKKSLKRAKPRKNSPRGFIAGTNPGREELGTGHPLRPHTITNRGEDTVYVEHEGGSTPIAPGSSALILTPTEFAAPGPDLTWYSIPPIPRVRKGESYDDPTFGGHVTRVTDCIAEGKQAQVPPYSNSAAGMTKKWGPIFMLYDKGGGHRLYSGIHPFEEIDAIPWGKYSPDEPESADLFGSYMDWMTFDGSFYRYDFDSGGGAELLFKIDSPSNRVFGDTHGLPSLNRRGVSWYVNDFEKRLAVVDFAERRLVFEAPYMTPAVRGFQQRTGTPTMAIDGEFFTLPLPRPEGGLYFYVFRVSTGKPERILVADYTYEHSCQAQLEVPGFGLVDLYVSKSNGKGKNPSSWIPTRETAQASYLLISSFEHGTKEMPVLSDFASRLTVPGWGHPSGVHLTGGAPGFPSRVAFGSFAPSNKFYPGYNGERLPPGYQTITVADLDQVLASGGVTGFRRLCWALTGAQMTESFGVNAYWAETHPMFIGPSAIAFGSDGNFHRPRSEWTLGVDTYVVEA